MRDNILELYEEHSQLINLGGQVEEARVERIGSILIDYGNGEGDRILDIGCGDGRVAQALKDHFGYEVVGIDVAPSFVEACRKRGLEVYRCNIEAEPLPEVGIFDAVIMTEVIEHLLDPMRVLRERISKVLKPEGIIIITAPNFCYLKHRISLLLGRPPDFGENHKLIIEPRPYNLFHKTFFNMETLALTLQMSGYDVLRCEGTPSISRRLFYPLKSIALSIRKSWPSLFASGITAVGRKRN
jgi:methionine biosynthesis protein MetW